MFRQALYSGTWYPSKKSEIEKYVDLTAKKQKALAAVCPHAGWAYSGRTAGMVFSKMEPAALYIILGPNHRGNGAPVSVYPEGSWDTPLGELEIDTNMVSSILSFSKSAKAGSSAHVQEHSIEVQLPFIKLFSPSAQIVPIAMYDYSLETCLDLGQAIAKAVSGLPAKANITIVASTDMSHYIPAAEAKKADQTAISRILGLDPEGLISTVSKNDISMCGVGPVASALFAAISLGASGAELVNYSNSGDVTGDNSEVVGYAGLIVS